MANPLLPAEWKKVLKDHKDAPDTASVTKALDGYAKAESRSKDDPQPALDALKEVVDAAKSARSANVKDKKRKPLVDFLDDVLKDAATMKVKTERLLQEKNERDREGEDEDEGGDNERAKLTERLFKVKKLEADAARPFVLALGGKCHGLVIAKGTALSGDHKKRARAMREGNGKIFVGRVFGEEGKYVFAMEVKPPGGLAKAIKKTAAMHTDLPPIRVILRGPDGFELEDETDAEEMADLGTETDEEEPEEGPAEVSRSVAATPPPSPKVVEKFQALYGQAERRLESVRKLASANASPLEPLLADARAHGEAGHYKEALTALKIFQDQANVALRPDGVTLPTAEASWERAHAGIEPAYLEALRDQPEKASSLRALMGFATGKAEAGDFKTALDALNRLRPKLSPAGEVNPGLAAWRTARQVVIDQLRRASKVIAATDNPYASDTVVELQAVIHNLSAEPSTPQAIAELEDYLRYDEVIDGAENLPTWVAQFKIREPLMNALAGLKS